MIRKFVITGGPCTGKTTVINELSKEFKTFPESARELYEEQGGDLRALDFQRNVFNRQLEHEENAEDHSGIIFFDRGLLDTIAYCRHHNFKVDESIMEGCKKARYEIIFLLETIPYKRDRMRIESREEAEKIHEHIKDAYQEFEHKVVIVPIMPLPERIEYIKKFID